MIEDVLLDNLKENERETMRNVCEALRGHENTIKNSIAEYVASLCNVSADDILGGKDGMDVIQARWMFFHAYKYMTGDTCGSIGRLVKNSNGEPYRPQSVSYGITQISALIESVPLWYKRWIILRSVIKKANDVISSDVEPINDEPVKIIVPKNIKVELIKK